MKVTIALMLLLLTACSSAPLRSCLNTTLSARNGPQYASVCEVRPAVAIDSVPDFSRMLIF